MNKPYVLFNLREAKEELLSLIEELESSDDCDPDDLMGSMQHLYSHINIAWNARNSSEEQATKCTEEDFKKWIRFPDDLDVDAFSK